MEHQKRAKSSHVRQNLPVSLMCFKDPGSRVKLAKHPVLVSWGGREGRISFHLGLWRSQVEHAPSGAPPTPKDYGRMSGYL